MVEFLHRMVTGTRAREGIRRTAGGGTPTFPDRLTFARNRASIYPRPCVWVPHYRVTAARRQPFLVCTTGPRRTAGLPDTRDQPTNGTSSTPTSRCCCLPRPVAASRPMVRAGPPLAAPRRAHRCHRDRLHRDVTDLAVPSESAPTPSRGPQGNLRQGGIAELFERRAGHRGR